MAADKPESEDTLLRQLRERMGNLRMEQSERPSVLEEVSLDGIVKHIQKISSAENPKTILVMTGAGISTAAGIPDFRTPGTGLYDNLQKYNLPSPMSIFDISYFPKNPKPFYHLAKEMYPGKFKPTLSHYFIRLLEQKGLLLRSYTQNIDTLERRAGIADESLVEAHGAFHIAHCITCGKEYPHDFVKEEVFADRVPMCTEPGCAYEPKEEGEEYRGIVKPDIVFFGEALPPRFGRLVGEDMTKCDMLIVMGTSLTVQPFASLANRVRDDCPRLLINNDKVGETDPLMMLLGMGSGFNFGDDSYRDVFLQGTCDDGVLELAKRLGWKEELMELFTREHIRLGSEVPAASGGKTELPSTSGSSASPQKSDKSSEEVSSKVASPKKSEKSSEVSSKVGSPKKSEKSSDEVSTPKTN